MGHGEDFFSFAFGFFENEFSDQNVAWGVGRRGKSWERGRCPSLVEWCVWSWFCRFGPRCAGVGRSRKSSRSSDHVKIQTASSKEILQVLSVCVESINCRTELACVLKWAHSSWAAAHPAWPCCHKVLLNLGSCNLVILRM